MNRNIAEVIPMRRNTVIPITNVEYIEFPLSLFWSKCTATRQCAVMAVMPANNGIINIYSPANSPLMTSVAIDVSSST